MTEGEESQPTTRRRGFLRRLATLAAVGLGVALVPSKALAEHGSCCNQQDVCPDSQCTDPNMPHNYNCGGCGSDGCCACSAASFTGCQTVPCPCP